MNMGLITNICALLLIIVGIFSPIYSEVILTMGLYSFSGAITNWLAIHMLFEKVPGLYGSGIITERFLDFKQGIRNLIMNQFFTAENFEKFMGQNASSLLKIEEETIFSTVDFNMVFEKLKSAIMESSFGGMLNMFGGAAALDPLKPQFEVKFKEIITELLNDEKFLNNLVQSGESDNDISKSVESMVDGRLDELTPHMVKTIIQDMIKEHLGWLVVWGGVFGALIGLGSSLLFP
jgi:uncharacterized membrane protein YheB (UPF0754 family)